VPWRSDFMREMDKMFEDFRRGFDYMLAPMRTGWMRPWFPWLETPDVKQPSTDLVDAGKEYRVCAEIPGIPKDKLNITVTAREIEIEGEAKTEIQEEEGGFVSRERGYSKIQRSLAFPEEVIPDEAKATLQDGLLEVRIPKKMPTEVKKHKVEIQ
jgi:HSP20 family protein